MDKTQAIWQKIFKSKMYATSENGMKSNHVDIWFSQALKVHAAINYNNDFDKVIKNKFKKVQNLVT